MATYQEIQEWVKEKYGFIPKIYWIADMKEDSCLFMSVANKR